LVKDASQRLSADMVLKHPWVKNGGATTRLETPAVIRKNHSAQALSIFAESCMSLNRIMYQHFSMNQFESGGMPFSESPPDECPFGLSPPSESRLAQRRLRSLSLNTEYLLTATG